MSPHRTRTPLSPVDAQQVIDHAADGIFVTDADGYYVDANPAGLAMVGYTIEELCTLHLRDLTHPESYLETPAKYDDLAARRPIHVERTLIRKDGSAFRAEISGHTLPSGHIVGLVRDVTERERLAEILRRYERVVSSVADLISLVDDQLRYLMVNDAYLLAHGIRAEDIVGKSVRELLGDEAFERNVKDRLTRALQGEVVSYEAWFDFKALGRRHCSVHYAPFRAASGKIIGVAVSVRDTTRLWEAHSERHLALEKYQALNLELEQRVARRTDELRAVNLELAELARSLEAKVEERSSELLRAAEARRELESQLLHAQKMEAVGRLVAGVAHDFNNLLTGVLANGCLLQNQLSAMPQQQALASEIVDVAERAAALTARLLAFGRREPSSPMSFDLIELIQGFRSMIDRLIGEDVRFVTDLDGPLPVDADPRQIEQVILNLAVNARDAMPSGGELRLTARATDATHGAPAYVELTVADTGEGMPPEVLDRVFEPFFTTKPPGQGTGLGLSTVRSIVHESGGSITVRSEPRQGTEFRILLPLREAPLPSPVTPDPQPATAPTATAKGSILVVDDDHTVRRVIERLLITLGYEVSATADPLEALDLVERRTIPFDLLLTDIVLPNMSGLELIQHVRAIHPDIRLLVMTGYGGDALHGEELDGVRVLGKPFRLDKLAATVDDVLASR